MELTFVGQIIVAFAVVAVLIIFWIVLRNIYTDGFSKNKSLLAGCGSLIVSLMCLVTIPIAFIYTLGAGMSGEDSSDLAVQVEVLSGLLFLILSIGISILAGVAGVIMLIAWAIKKNKTSND